MKNLCLILLFAALLGCVWSCTSKQNDQLTEQQKDQIKKEIIAVGDSIMSRLQKLDPKWFDYYVDSPDWGMANADGTRWDYQTTLKVQPDFFNSLLSWKWTTTKQDFKFLAKDVVLCAWDGKDETVLKSADKILSNKDLSNMYTTDTTNLLSGDKIIYNPHTYTLIFKKIDGQWRVIYSHDSGIAVITKAEKK